MNVTVELCVIPIGVGTSLSPYIAECQKVIEAAGLVPHLHAYGTNIEGDWDQVMAVVKRCHERLHEMGAPRIHSQLKVGTQIAPMPSLNEKISSVSSKL